jgi:hypothetical protein
MGPQGFPGAPGPEGLPGPSDVFINSSLNGAVTLSSTPAAVAALSNLPAGSYLISAKVTIGPNVGSAGQDYCALSVGGTIVDYSYATINPSGGILYQTAKLLTASTFATATNSIVVTCMTTFGGSAVAQYPVLTAMKVGSVTTM